MYLALFELFRSTYRTQQRLERALVQAERLRAVGEMASGVAHDFNNVLTVILGRAQLLLSRSRDLRSEGGEQALRVIIFNALDAMPEGGTLTATSSLARDIIDVTIADTGTGMSDGVKRRIFEPFFSTKGERGTGLGLSVAHGIVASYGGTIDVESKVGRGTRVMLRFPREGGPGPGPASKGV